MAKPITCSPELIEQLLDKARAELTSKKFQSERISLSIALEKDERIAEVYFSATAWIKIHGLVAKFSTEVQWHGTVRRLTDTQFLVEDILVFPHEVSSTTVVSKQEEYEQWKDSLDDDTFNKLRLHGHSHVKMNVRPSGTDDDVQSKFLKNLAKPTPDYDPFFIFIIVNKDGDIHCQVYDVTNNALYDNDEVVTDVYLDNDTYLDAFVQDAKKLATEPVRTPAAGFGNNHHYGNYHNQAHGKKKKDKTTDPDDIYDTLYGYGRFE
jgi:hypothetical protein